MFVIVIGGFVLFDCLVVYEKGIDVVFSIIMRLMILEEVYKVVEENIEMIMKNIVIVWKIVLEKYF